MPKGWLVLHNDTIRLEPPTQMIRKNKPKRVHTISKTGILLKKGDIVYAGFDQYYGNDILYVSPELDYVDRIKILTCFFVIACYTHYM